jgi:hypothetical protein
MGHNDGANLLQLLVDTGVLDSTDAENAQAAQSETLLDLMVKKRALLPSEVEQARAILHELLVGTNQTRKLKAQMSLVRIITGNLHRRMSRAGDRIREQKERVTGDNLAVVALAKRDGNS